MQVIKQVYWQLATEEDIANPSILKFLADDNQWYKLMQETAGGVPSLAVRNVNKGR